MRLDALTDAGDANLEEVVGESGDPADGEWVLPCPSSWNIILLSEEVARSNRAEDGLTPASMPQTTKRVDSVLDREILTNVEIHFLFLQFEDVV